MHSHEFWELSYVYEGRGTHHFENGSAAAINEGEFIFMSPDVSHCITSPPSDKSGWTRVCNMLMTQKYVDALTQRLLSLHELDEYKLRDMLRDMLRDKKQFCIHLGDDS